MGGWRGWERDLHIGQREVHEARDGGGDGGGEEPVQHRGDGGSVGVGDRQLLEWAHTIRSE